MNLLNYTDELITRIKEKTIEGKIVWLEETSGSSTSISSRPTSELSAIFRLSSSTPFEAQWQRFLLYQKNEQLLQVFNPEVIRYNQSDSDKVALPAVNYIFQLIALRPRENRLKNHLLQLEAL